MVKTGKFSKKYGLFLSDASNEEIVSVSKELLNGMSDEVRSVNATALALLASSLVSLILLISLVSGMDSTLAGNLKAIIFLTRISAIALLCLSALTASLSVSKMSDASSISSILWRNIRETADDERAYEQTQAVKAIGVLVTASKRMMKLTAVAIAIAGMILGFGFVFELLDASSYI